MATHEITRPLALNVTALEIAQALQDVIVTTPVVDNLTTNDGSKALSAKMGKKLNDEKFAIADIASALGQDVDKVPSNKVVDDAINAISDVTDLTSRLVFESTTVLTNFRTLMYKTGNVVHMQLSAEFLQTQSANWSIKFVTIPSEFKPRIKDWPAINGIIQYVDNGDLVTSHVYATFSNNNNGFYIRGRDAISTITRRPVFFANFCYII